jgi:hypothetical protein
MDALDFTFDLLKEFTNSPNARMSGYIFFEETGIYLRIKDHAPDFSNFGYTCGRNDKIRKIISVNTTGSECQKHDNRATTLEEFHEDFPDIEVVEICFNFEDVDFRDIVEQINKHL